MQIGRGSEDDKRVREDGVRGEADALAGELMGEHQPRLG